MDLDAIGLWRQQKIVCHLDLWNDKTIFQRELLAHLVDAMCQFQLRCEKPCGELFAKAQFDLCGLKAGRPGNVPSTNKSSAATNRALG